MASIHVNGHTYETDLLVFDKDGLMFDSEQFWIEMANARIRSLSKYCSAEQIFSWAKLMGVKTQVNEKDEVSTVWVDPVGILAVAPPPEEIIILASFLVANLGILWHEARNIAADIFTESDKGIDLTRGLKAQPGLTELMDSINKLGIPYGVATSDTYDRTRDSMTMYNCWQGVRFVVTPEDVPRGKPNPDMLEYVSVKNNVPLNRIVMIGDSYVDVKMAHSTGSVGIGVSTSSEMREKMKPFATEIVDSLTEITVSD